MTKRRRDLAIQSKVRQGPSENICRLQAKHAESRIKNRIREQLLKICGNVKPYSLVIGYDTGFILEEILVWS